VVYGIVKQSGGQIRVRSEAGKGTCVEIYLARVMETDMDDASKEVGLEACNETILLVEDEELVRKVVARILDRAGYHVIVAAGGIEALSLSEELAAPVDVLVTDIVMPGVGGKELATRLAAKFPRMKILFMTGYTDDEFLRTGILDQGRAILLKPFSPEDLLRKLREVFNT
jgi:CheY-like chemotaxis protein